MRSTYRRVNFVNNEDVISPSLKRNNLNLPTLLSIGLLLFLSATNCGSQNKSANDLINENSPYLLQHAYNPVHWMPWGPKALAKAEKENKMIIISIGYSSCHWCHVMEEESFEDEEVAQMMNDNFVCIKVDREERPDVDNIYMSACQLSSDGGCGWPLNAFALPDGKPVWAGTYFPKDQWLKILKQFSDNYQTEPTKMMEYADRLTEGLANMELVNVGEKQELTESIPKKAAEAIVSISDFESGGREGAPKFPMPVIYEFMQIMNHYSENPLYEKTITSTLDHIGLGGIHDQLEGGISRYSTDAEWFVPHFEKMLYDNAQLLSRYSQSYQVTGDSYNAQMIHDIAGFMIEKWQDKSGGFYSSFDADSEGEEGLYYVWTDSLLKEASGDLYDFARELYNTTPEGNWEEGKNILYLTATPQEIAAEKQINPTSLMVKKKELDRRLLEAKNEWIRPGLDDKILTSWNALAISGLVDAYKATGEEGYKEKARETMDFLLSNMVEADGHLMRNYKDGAKKIDGFLEDYSFLIMVCIDLYEVTHDPELVLSAKTLADYAIANFYDNESKMFFYTDKNSHDLVAQKTELADNVIPSSNSSLCRGLHRLYSIFTEPEYKKISDQMLYNMIPQLQESENADFYSNWYSAYLEKLYPTWEIAVVGPDYASIAAEFYNEYHPNTIIMASADGSDIPFLKNKLVEGQTTIYICQEGICQLPTTDVEVAKGLMKKK